MASASEPYLIELAEEFLASQTRNGWDQLARSSFRGETVSIDATADEPSVEIEVNVRRLPEAVEVEITAYEPDDAGQPVVAVRRVGTVRKPT